MVLRTSAALARWWTRSRLDLQGRGEGRAGLYPDGSDGGWHDDQYRFVQTAVVLQVQDVGDELQRLAEAHVVAEHTADAGVRERVQPAQTLALVVAQLAAEGGGSRRERFLVDRHQALQRVAHDAERGRRFGPNLVRRQRRLDARQPDLAASAAVAGVEPLRDRREHGAQIHQGDAHQGAVAEPHRPAGAGLLAGRCLQRESRVGQCRRHHLRQRVLHAVDGDAYVEVEGVVTGHGNRVERLGLDVQCLQGLAADDAHAGGLAQVECLGEVLHVVGKYARSIAALDGVAAAPGSGQHAAIRQREAGGEDGLIRRIVLPVIAVDPRQRGLGADLDDALGVEGRRRDLRPVVVEGQDGDRVVRPVVVLDDVSAKHGGGRAAHVQSRRHEAWQRDDGLWFREGQMRSERADLCRQDNVVGTVHLLEQCLVAQNAAHDARRAIEGPQPLQADEFVDNRALSVGEEQLLGTLIVAFQSHPLR